MSIAKNIKQIRKHFNLTQEELGQIANVSPMAVSQWENGRSSPRMGAIQGMMQSLGVGLSDILGEESDFQTNVYSSGKTTVPLTAIGRVHAGTLVDEESIADNVEVPAHIFNAHPSAFALTVEGACMNKVIPEGAHILVDPTVQPHNGSIVVIENENYQAILRRFYRGSSTLMLSADSYDQFDDILLDENSGSIRLVGTVIWFQSSEELS